MKKFWRNNPVTHPEMLTWQILPFLVLVIVTHYIFAQSQPRVLGVNTESDKVINIGQLNSSGNPVLKDDKNWTETGAVSLLFIGAHRSQLEQGYPLINEKGYRGMVSVSINEVGLPGYLTWLNLKLLQSKGWEIVSQSRDQICDKQKLSDADVIESEVVGSKEDLVKMGLEASLYLPPCGLRLSKVTELVKNNYAGSMAFGIETNSPSSINKYRLVIRQVNNQVNFASVKTWISNAEVNQTWLILGFPDIGEEKDTNHVSLDLFSQTVKEVQKSKLKVSLAKELL